MASDVPTATKPDPWKVLEADPIFASAFEFVRTKPAGVEFRKHPKDSAFYALFDSVEQRTTKTSALLTELSRISPPSSPTSIFYDCAQAEGKYPIYVSLQLLQKTITPDAEAPIKLALSNYHVANFVVLRPGTFDFSACIPQTAGVTSMMVNFCQAVLGVDLQSRPDTDTYKTTVSLPEDYASHVINQLERIFGHSSFCTSLKYNHNPGFVIIEIDLANLFYTLSNMIPGQRNFVIESTDGRPQLKYLLPENTTIHRAIIEGKSADEIRALATGASVSAVDSNGDTPLHLAVAGGRADLIPILANPLTINYLNKQGFSPVFLIDPRSLVTLRNIVSKKVQSDIMIAMLQALYSQGANLNIRQGGGDNLFTPLLRAIAQGDYPALYIKELLERGADPKFSSPGHICPVSEMKLPAPTREDPRAVISDWTKGMHRPPENALALAKRAIDSGSGDVNAHNILHYISLYCPQSDGIIRRIGTLKGNPTFESGRASESDYPLAYRQYYLTEDFRLVFYTHSSSGPTSAGARASGSGPATS